jgi:MFS transporter, ACS family, hexuronate transporter
VIAPRAGRYRILGLLTATQIGSAVIQQGLGVLAPIFIAEFAVSKAQLGAIFGAMFLGTASCTAIAGVMTDRLGERRMIAISASLMTIALLSACAVENYLWLVITMTLFGIAYASSAPAGTRAILAWFDRDRGFAMAFRQTGVTLGGLIGALMLPFVALHFGGYRAALFASAILVAVPAAITLLVYREPGFERGRKQQSFRQILRELPAHARDPRLLTVAGTAIVLVSLQQAMNGFLTVTNVTVVGLNPTTAAVAFACAQGSATFGRLFWGWVSDRFLGGERIGMLGGLAVVGSLSAFAVAVQGPATQAWAIPVALFLGLGAAGWNGVQVAALGEIGGPARAGSVLGLALTVIFGASAIAPVAFGAIADHTSLKTAWTVFAAMALLGVIPPFLLKRRKAAVPGR